VWWSAPPQVPVAPPKKTKKKPKPPQPQKKRKTALQVSILLWLVIVAGFVLLTGSTLTTAVGALVALVPAALTYTALSARRRRQLTQLPGRPR
jgi:Flp pilus assembly protein TadB